MLSLSMVVPDFLWYALGFSALFLAGGNLAKAVSIQRAVKLVIAEVKKRGIR